MREGSRNRDETNLRCPARQAVIGPTTASALEEELGMLVDVVAAKPNPEALAEGIAKFDENHA